MVISKIQSDMTCYETSVDDVKSIELTRHGSDETTVYKVTYEDGSALYAGLLEHEVYYQEGQMTIFDCL